MSSSLLGTSTINSVVDPSTIPDEESSLSLQSRTTSSNEPTIRSEMTRTNPQREQEGGLSSYVAPENSTGRKLSAFENTLSISKLRFDKLEFYGRQEEKKVLQESIKRITTPIRKADGDGDDSSVGRNEMVLISGISGCGKTTLANHVAKSVKRANGMFVHGKCDMNSTGGPYSSIKAACLQICGELLHLKNSDNPRFSEIQSEITEVLGAELKQLIGLLPELQDVVGEKAPSEDLSFTLGSPDTKGLTEASELCLHQVFRRFMQIISSRFSPFVMVLDDFQRADNASLKLMHSVISDPDNRSGLVLVVTYRSDEVDETHILSDFIEGVKMIAEKESSGLASVKEIKLENFTVDDLVQILLILLNMDDREAIASLAEICHKRTLGNMFYFSCFLMTLKEENLLQFSVSSYKWVWDEKTILSATAAAGNVVDLIRNRLMELTKAVQKRLSFAACLGSSFDTETEGVVWEQISKVLTNTGDTDGWLEVSEKNGILERITEKEYRWPHDQVQEAVLSLLSEEDLPGFQNLVGEALLHGLPDSKREASLFTIVDLLNAGNLSPRKVPRLEMAELHKLAVDKAYRQVALDSMSQYAKIGVEYLPVDAWQTHYHLTLELHSRGAEAANLLGEKELLRMHAGEVLKQKDRPLADKLRAYNAMIDSLGREQDSAAISEALEMLLDLLSKLGCKFPKGKFSQLCSTVKSLVKVKRKVKTLKEKDIVAMTQMAESSNQLFAMALMQSHMNIIFLSSPDLLGLWFLRFAELTLEYGICEYSPAAFAQLGHLFLIMNDFTTAMKCGGFAEKLVKSFDSKTSRNALAVYQIYGFSLAFKRPYHQLMPALLDGYRDGLAVGDQNSIGSCIVFYVYMSFAAGKHLRTVEADCRRYHNQAKELKNEQAATNLRTLWQCALNLLGRSENTCILTGEAILDIDSFTASINVEAELCLVRYVQCYLCAIFGLFETGSAMALEDEGRFNKAGPGIFMNMHETFVRGLCLFGMARKSKQSKYKKAGKRVLSTIRKWVRNDNPNVLHYEKLFEAELRALEGKLDAAELLYHQALSLAARSGFIQDAAIINERCGDFFLRKRKSPDDAMYKMKEACKLYEEWGCRKKVEMIRKEFRSLKEAPSGVITVRR